jgi:hypothetical protein
MDHYEIVVKGHLDERWADWYGGMNVKHLPTGETILSGPVKDQSALHGILSRIRDMNLILLNVKRKKADLADRTG